MELSWRRLQSDESLAAACLSGETEAFDELVSRYQDRIFSLCYRMCGSRESANDFAQESFVRAYERLDQYDPARPFYPWLKQVTVNLCLNAIRDRRRETEEEATSDTWEERLSDAKPTPEHVVIDADLEQRVQAAIVELPPRYRAVAVLRYIEDNSYDEIAEALDLPLGTVKTQLFRAREQLRRTLRDVLREHVNT